MSAVVPLPDGADAQVSVSETIEVRVGAETASFPFPDRGLAHVELSSSPSGRYVVLQHCSGQSEESYLVLDRHTSLSTTASATYVSGETNSFGFSSDERFLVAAIPSTCVSWWDYLEDAEETDEAGRVYFEFGTLLTHDLGTCARTTTSVRVWVEDDWSELRGSYDPLLRPVFTSPHTVVLHLPWGSTELRFPFGKVVWLRPPA